MYIRITAKKSKNGSGCNISTNIRTIRFNWRMEHFVHAT